MAVKYAQIINSFVSTEGSNGFMTNYVYYTMLVVNTDGSRSIVEGKYSEISYLVPYVRTSVDELEELKSTVKNLRKDINEIAEQKVKYVIDSLFPIPDILNKTEVEACDLLEKAGFEPVYLNAYPESTPRNGVVRAYVRNRDNFKKVDMKIFHDAPVVTGLKIEEALKKLEAAGFQAVVMQAIVAGKEDGIVLDCARNDDDKLEVGIWVSRSVPEIVDLTKDEAVKRLSEAGYRTAVVTVVNPEKIGKVVQWEIEDENTIKIFVGIQTEFVAKNVDVKWSNMQESTGDNYSVTAVYDSKTRWLKMKLTYTIGAKTKHQIVGIDVLPSATQRKYEYDCDYAMDPNVTNTVQIDCPFSDQFLNQRSEVKITLRTQSGFMKKKENIDLVLAFDW